MLLLIVIVIVIYTSFSLIYFTNFNFTFDFMANLYIHTIHTYIKPFYSNLGPDYMRVFNPGVEFQPTLPS